MIDMGIFPHSRDNEELVVKRITDVKFRLLVRSLNVQQMKFFLSCFAFNQKL